MAAPTCSSQTVEGRHSYKSEILYDVNSGAPFPPLGSGDPNLGGYTWEVEQSAVGPVGPWSPAPINNSLVSICSGQQPSNIVGIGAASSQVLIGDTAPTLFVNSQHWTRWTLRDQTATPVPGGQLVCGPVKTNNFPSFTCLGVTATATTGHATYGSTGDPADIDDGCDTDLIQWEISSDGGTTWSPSGGPAPINSLSPSHTFTGLTPSTPYQIRGRLSESVALGNAEYLVGPVCSFSTTADLVNSCGSVHDRADCVTYSFGSGYGQTTTQCWPPGTGSTVT